MNRGRWLSWVAVLAMIMAGFATTASRSSTPALAAPPPLSNTLQGCTNPKAIGPPYNPGTLICPDADYVNSVLKGWSDLDIVPFRLFMQAGNSAPTTPTTYSVSVAVDNLTFGNPAYPGGVIGYSALSQPTLNTSPADGSQSKARVVTNAACSYTVTPTATASPPVSKQLPADPHPVNGSASKSLYWTITVTMSRNQNCVFDLNATLSFQADQVAPGRCDAKLHADLADASLNLQKTGAKEVPIQICDIHPLKFQPIDHTLTAQQNVDNIWTISNGITPDHINFSNTCDPSASGPQKIQVNVNWAKIPQPGVITISPTVSIHDPAQRVVYAQVTDVVENGTGASANVFQTLTFSGPVQPNTVTQVINTPFTEPAGTDVSQLNQQITVTYYSDPGFTQQIGQLTGSDTAVLQQFNTNTTAQITNTETMNETDGSTSLQFSVDSYQIYDAANNPVGAANTGGSFGGGYVLGTPIKGSVVWNYNASDTGSVTFNKTISLDTVANPLPQLPTGNLTDQSDLLASSGFAASTSSAVDITSAEKVTVTINKTIPFTLSATDAAQTFTFDVQDPYGNDILVDDGSGNMVMPSVTLTSGQNSGSVQVPGLDPSTAYTVTEQPTPGWDAPPGPNSVTVTVTAGNLASCGTATVFANTIHANVTVQKVTNPAGNEAGWTFNLLDPSNAVISTVTTTGAGAISFPVNLTQEGSYTVQEVAQPGWLQTNVQNATFTVDFPASGAQTYAATFTNTQETASATVQKITYPAGNEAGWSFTLYDPNGNAIGTAKTTGTGAINFVDSGGNPVKLTKQGTYTVKETSSKSGWWNTAATGQTFTINWGAGGTTNGQTYAAQFTNTQCVAPKISASSNSSGLATFSITDASTPSTGTGLIGGSLPALNPLALGTQVNSTGANGVGMKVIKLVNATMPASSWSDGAGTLTLTAQKQNLSAGASIGLVATALGGTPATVTVSSTGAVTITNAGTCSTAFDPLVTSAIRQAGAPQTDTYTGIDKSESQLTIYNGKPGVGTMKIQVNTTTFTVAGMKDGDQKVLDIGSALVAGGNNTISVTSTGQPGGNAVLLVAPPGAAH